MSVALSVQHYLEDAQIKLVVIEHGFSKSAYDSACAARIPSTKMIKSIVLRDRINDDYLLAITPANHKLKLSWLNSLLGRNFILAKEIELSELFPDCRLGAVPAIGQPYGIEVIWDNALQQQPQLYFEAGDHEGLIQLSHQQFDQLFQQQSHDVISAPSEYHSLYQSDEMSSSY